MKPIITALFASLFVVSAFSAQVVLQSSNNENLSIRSEQEFHDLLSTLLGLNSGSMSEQLKAYIKNNKISIMNAVDEISLLFVAGENQPAQSSFEITKNFVSKIKSSMGKINYHFVSGSDQQVKSYISQNLDGKTFQQINVDHDQISRIQHLFTSQPARLLEQEQVIQPAPTPTPATSSSYITKFFFIIMFIIVTFGTLGAIAAMENRKDSLLYAKFLTDVSGR